MSKDGKLFRMLGAAFITTVIFVLYNIVLKDKYDIIVGVLFFILFHQIYERLGED